ncbi:hypothetical protein MUN89_18945 [Halobacillus salinarum]|uniref:Family 2 glycosyl transferase n=1 Tax=Halobacillus salinarum TaxID=2932257 RepID=A0ABY4EHL2_9BACI|nr:hypothetical protein [Halobacillus salinarum]UOQ43920.1 hypothetical protein MUN89_18945 [Halobacillus salinarum]
MKWKGKAAAILLVIIGIGSYVFLSTQSVTESKQIQDGTHIKFKTSDKKIQIYKDGSWSPFFIKGVNLGATLPGHFPGEMPISKKDYMNWFQMIQDMGVNTIRIYTIHKPVFYEALVEFNEDNKDDPLYFMQGIWSPVNLMNKTKNASSEEVTKAFKKEIDHAIGAVYGSVTLPDNPGKASGKYTADASPYLIAWHVGTEWNPKIVKSTNQKNQQAKVFNGSKISAKKAASPFESWLAELLNYTARKEAIKGWQHPLTFTNWITTDPLEHPNEPLPSEDSVSVDATHLNVENWQAGYFASFHAYPYYPDFLNETDKYEDVKNSQGKTDTYKGYLQDLKKYHKDIPVMITEFGVPSSLGNAHFGNLGRDQGGHSEKEQGKQDAALLKEIHNEGYAGAVLFSWQDEWFKKTWNTMPFVKSSSRPRWYNDLSPEMSFGVLAMDPEKTDEIKIDGKQQDWEKLPDDEKQKMDVSSNTINRMQVSHDEGFVYITAKLARSFEPEEDTLYFGVDTIDGGIQQPEQLKGKKLSKGLETLIHLGKEGEIRIASDYDFHQRLYEEADSTCNNNNCFEPWRLAVSHKLEPPQANMSLPFKETVVGNMQKAQLDNPSAQALWQIKDDIIEMKIPWALLGFSDPSRHQVVSYKEKSANAEKLPMATAKGITFVPWMVKKESGVEDYAGMDTIQVSDFESYQWDNWDKVKYTERKKAGYKLLKKAFQSID